MGIGVFALFMVTVFRYYGDVEYRLTLNYQRYFIYYFLIGVGYLAGFVVYRITNQWIMDLSDRGGRSSLLCAVTGSVFHKFFQRSGHFSVGAGAGIFPDTVVSDHEYDDEYGPSGDQADSRE